MEYKAAFDLFVYYARNKNPVAIFGIALKGISLTSLDQQLLYKVYEMTKCCNESLEHIILLHLSIDSTSCWHST